MARTRSIKPGFFTNDDLGTLSPLHRLLYAGLWCIADREGRLEDRPDRIKVQVLPYDKCSVVRLLTELEDHEYIVRYEVRGKKLIWLPTFHLHQKPHHKEEPSTLPPCPMEASSTDSSMTHASAMDEPSMSHPQVMENGSCLTLTLNPLPDPSSHPSSMDEPPAATRETPIPAPKRTVPTQEWLNEIRPKYAGLKDFDDSVRFAMNSSYYAKKPDKRAYILGSLDRSLERELQRLATASNGNGHRDFGPVWDGGKSISELFGGEPPRPPEADR